MITIKTFVVNDFQENTYILFDETNECIIVDPGCNNTAEKKELDAFINENKLVPKVVLNTHGHIDHVLGCKYFCEEYNIPFVAHEDEIPLIKNAMEFGLFFGLEVEQPPLPERTINDGEIFRFGKSEIKILHVPGHSPGGIALYSPESNIVITGDTLFKGSIGRTDLPGGSYNTLINSIETKLFTLPVNTLVFPGHGTYTTIDDEKKSNPFFN